MAKSITLEQLLKRRGFELSWYADELGIKTYSSLCDHCSSMGVVPPEEDSCNFFTEEVVVVTAAEIAPVEELRNGFVSLSQLNEEQDVI